MTEIIGIPSGDHEGRCFDIPLQEFIKIEGHNPSLYDRSYRFKGLYRTYEVPTCKAINQYNYSNKFLIKVVYDDYGIKSIEETDVVIIFDDEWHYYGEDDDNSYNNDYEQQIHDDYMAHMDIR